MEREGCVALYAIVRSEPVQTVMVSSDLQVNYWMSVILSPGRIVPSTKTAAYTPAFPS